jgi:hypothetical protein
MENTKRTRKEKSRIRPSGRTYVEPKDLLNGLERVREAARSESTSLRYTPEVGAQCISSACRDLCEGCRGTGIPTATAESAWRLVLIVILHLHSQLSPSIHKFGDELI